MAASERCSVDERLCADNGACVLTVAFANRGLDEVALEAAPTDNTSLLRADGSAAGAGVAVAETVKGEPLTRPPPERQREGALGDSRPHALRRPG